jgi:DNA-binding beta-propeller fold protein YncE
MFLVIATGTSTAEKARLVSHFSITGDYLERSFSFPNNVFIDDEHGEIYVVDAGNRRVVVFEMDGYYRYHFAVPATLGEPVDLAVDNIGDILVVGNGGLAVCDFRGNLLEYMEFEGFHGAESVQPVRIEINSEGNCYIVDGFQRVLAFDSDWNFKLAIDKENFPKLTKKTFYGEERLIPLVESLTISDFCVDDEGAMYLLDSLASKVYVFDAEGKYLRSMGQPGASFTTLSFPKGVAVDREGRVLVVDATSHSLLGYSKEEGRFLFALGGMGGSEGRFYYPRRVATDKGGRIYTVEPARGRVQVLTVEYVTTTAPITQ